MSYLRELDLFKLEHLTQAVKHVPDKCIQIILDNNKTS